jgi:hypothetical protein
VTETDQNAAPRKSNTLTVIVLVLIAAAFYFGFIVVTAIKG